MSRTTPFALTILGLGLCAFLGCSGSGGDTKSSSGSSTTPTGMVGSAATDIEGKDATGATVKLSDYKGSVIILDVSAEWCPPCNADAVPLEQLYQKYKAQGLKVVTVLSENNAGGIPELSSLQNWVAKGLTFRVMNDTTGTTPKAGKAESLYVSYTNGFPTFVVIDKGFVVRYIQGGFAASAVENKVKELLAQ